MDKLWINYVYVYVLTMSMNEFDYFIHLIFFETTKFIPKGYKEKDYFFW
jgi:hypothetical protein